jgi:hypothetical protein
MSGGTIKTETTDTINKIMENKNFKAVLYIILILYASVIAPKLPEWLMNFLDNPIIKMFIVFLIGFLFTQDSIAAIIATVGVTITYLIIAQTKINNYAEDVVKEKKQCKIQKQINPITNKEEKIVNNNENFNTLSNNYINHTVEYFNNNSNNYINHTVEHFNNNNYINHTEENL